MDDETPVPRPRRSTLPPAGGGGRDRDRLEARVSVLERTEQHQEQVIEEIKRTTAKTAGTVDAIDTAVTTLSAKVAELLEKRKFWQKVQTGVLIGLVMVLFGFLARISFIVQTGKISP